MCGFLRETQLLAIATEISKLISSCHKLNILQGGLTSENLRIRSREDVQIFLENAEILTSGWLKCSSMSSSSQLGKYTVSSHQVSVTHLNDF